MAPQRPTSILVLAILHFVFGALGVMGGSLGLYMEGQGGDAAIYEFFSRLMPAGSKQQKDMQDMARAGQMRNDFLDAQLPSRPVVRMASLVAGLLLSVCLIAAGVLLLRMKPAGRLLSLVYGVVQILLVAGMILFLVFVQGPVEDKVYKTLAEKDRHLAQLASDQDERKPLTIVVSLLGLIYPLVVLVLLSRPHVSAAFGREFWEVERDEKEMGYGRRRQD